MFAFRVAKFVKSNAIVYCAGGRTLGIGAGQMSRVDSTRIAAAKAQGAGLSLAGSVVASDAFFPFRDGLDVVADNGAVAVIQPGGSVRDDEVIAAADERGIAMVFTGVRHFQTLTSFRGVEVSVKRLWSLAAVVAALDCAPALAVDCDGDPDSTELSYIDRACSRLVDTWKKGKNEIILSGYSWHTPWTWTAERRAEERAWAWGGGYGRTVEEPNGNTHTVFGLAFLDSHSNIEWQIGYGWSTFWGPRDGVQPGLGYTAMIVQRPDIANGIPFPAVLPISTASLRSGQGRRDVHPELRRRHQSRQRALRLRARDPRLSARPRLDEHPRRRRRRTRARARVEDRSVAARREGVRGAGQRRHGARAGLTNCPGTAIADLVAFAAKEPIALTIVGPEAPLAAGIVDAFRAAGLRIFGATKAAAQLESSKDYAKAFMARHGIPSAQSRTFEDAAAARAYVSQQGAPIVVEGGRPRGGQGRGHRAKRCRSACRHRRDARRPFARRRRRARW